MMAYLRNGIVAVSLFSSQAIAEESFRIGVPIACRFGETCFIQQYVDRDNSPAVLDYACGGITYDGHDGVDIRILSAASAAAGVKVLAPADGIVKATRDGMADQLVLDESTRAAVAKKECGNGVVLEHPAGWQTQLCHMRKGSIAVKNGDRVSAGQPIGDVGYSGLAAFPHVHITVRKDGVVMDPFTGTPASDRPTCPAGPAERPLWTTEALSALVYRKGEIIETGFASAPVSPDDLERNGGSVPPPTSTDTAFIFYGRFINLQAGDLVRVSILGPEAFVATNTSDALVRSKASYVAFTGKRLRVSRWPAGRYSGRAELIRNGLVIESREQLYDLPK